MSTLLLLRHAQASFGAQTYDALSDLGHAQARSVGAHFAARGERFTRVLIGPRRRHARTARLSLEPLGVSAQPALDPALDEFAEGQQILVAAEARGSHAEQARAYGARIEAWCQARAEIAGVRSAAEFHATALEGIARAVANDEPGQRVLVVTSAGVIAAAMTQALGLPLARMGEFMRALHNASLSEFAFSAGRAPALVSFNASTHLPRELLTRL